MNLTIGKWIDRWIGIPLVFAARFLDVLAAPFRRRDRIELKRILMIKLWGAGNIVLILPIIRALRETHPEAKLHFLTLEGNVALLRRLPELDGVIGLGTGSIPAFLASVFGALRSLLRVRADVVIDFEQFCRASALLARLSGAPHRVGLATPGQMRHGLYTATVPYDDGQHMSRTFLSVARVVGVPDRWRPLAPPLTEADHRAAAAVVAEIDQKGLGGPLLVIHAGSGANFPGRRWPAASFAALTGILVHHHRARVIFTGTPDEAELIEGIRSAAGVPSVSAVGKLDFTGLAALLGRADALFSNDTAPVHLAGAQSCPVFAFYGPNTPRLYGPVGVDGEVFYSGLPCSPCLTNLNAKESRCRLPVCIENISVGSVAEAFARFLGRREESARENRTGLETS